MLVCIQCVEFVADLALSLACRARHSSSESKHTRSGQSHNRRPGTSRFRFTSSQMQQLASMSHASSSWRTKTLNFARKNSLALAKDHTLCGRVTPREGPGFELRFHSKMFVSKSFSVPPRTWHQSGYRTGLPEYERSHACCLVKFSSRD